RLRVAVAPRRPAERARPRPRSEGTSIAASSRPSRARALTASELIDPAIAERVLTRALAHGGRFAEVFAERRRGLTMSIDESRIESVQSGAEEGAGVRVVEDGRTYFAPVDGLAPAALERAATP